MIAQRIGGENRVQGGRRVASEAADYVGVLDVGPCA